MGLSQGGAPRDRLAEAFRQRLGVPHVFFVSSGRAAMTEVLKVLKARNPQRDEFVVPGYTCYSVAASGVRAGLRIRPLDVELATLDYQPAALETLDPERVLAVASANLYGIPNDLSRLEKWCSEGGVTLIDDAAQALGAQCRGRWAGTFGDVGIFSFDKGKNITTIQGGVVVCQNDALAGELRNAFDTLPEPPLSVALRQAFSLLGYWVLLRPELYWVPEALLPLGGTPFETDYPSTHMPWLLAPMAERLHERIDTLTDERVRNAERYDQLFEGVHGVAVIDKRDGTPVYPRFPLLVDAAVRDDLVRLLQQSGLGASSSYPEAVVDIPELAAFMAPSVGNTPGAREVARRIVTLPTHAYVTEDDMKRIAKEIQSFVSGHSSPVEVS